MPDAQGSVRVVFQAATNIKSIFAYGAYGGRTCAIPSNNRHCDWEPTFGYTGQYQDEESGLVYLRARYYDPLTQQFLSRDPLEGASGQPYAYAWGNPINYTDPAGLLGELEDKVPPRGPVTPPRGGGVTSGQPSQLPPEYIGPERQLPPGRTINGMAPQRYPRTIHPSEGRGPRGRAGQRALEELYGPGRQETFDTPIRTRKGTGRVPDLVVRQSGRIYAHESCVACGEVKLGSHKGGQAYKDAWLMKNVPGYTPVWHFWQGPPSRPLARLLTDLNIQFMVYGP